MHIVAQIVCSPQPIYDPYKALQYHYLFFKGGSPSARTAQGNAVSNCSRWTTRTRGASLMPGRPARAAKNPETHAAISGASGNILSGFGPPS